ncbi:hypothetical protein [Streptomyces sp. NPDC053431]|uniref:hypothetical protein n=1 Tax=Streptomyces sp. NPDC053431 TaxID=3365703 RepID=UPI0037D84C49
MTSPASSPRQHGLLEKLMATVRTEVIDIDPDDLVFGGPPCRVSGCSRIGRSRGLCIGHHHRWNGQGRPDLEEFAATTEPLMRGYAPLAACRVTGCHYGVQGRGLCQNYRWTWRHAGSPPLEQWLPEQSPAEKPQDHAQCLVSFCDLWAQGSTPFCISHRSRWRQADFPEPAEFIKLYEEHPPGHERLDVRRLTGQLRLEMQYALQRRHDDQRIKTPPSRVRHVVCFVAGTGVRSLLD